MIIVSALTRYHVFNLALELQRHGLLSGLVTGYPSTHLGSFANLQSALTSHPSFGIARKLAIAAERFNYKSIASELNRNIYAAWSRAFARDAAQSDARFIYGLSGYMLETIRSMAPNDRTTIVDHGSLHIEYEKEVLEQECSQYGFSKFGNGQLSWLVDRMNEEFSVADKVVCCSALALKTLIDRGVAPEKILVRRLGVDFQHFKQSARTHNRSNRRTRFLFVGAMTPLKGVHYLLTAFERLKQNAELWLVGATPTDPVLQKKIESSSNLTERIQIIGPVPQQRLIEIYAQCDIFVLPSLCDGWGMVVNQALACGLPSIVSDSTGAKEIISEGENGYIVKSRDADDLAEKMNLAIADLHAGNHDQHAHWENRSWAEYGNEWAAWLNEQ